MEREKKVFSGRREALIRVSLRSALRDKVGDSEAGEFMREGE